MIALTQLEKEKGISKQLLIETIEAALITAYKKNFGTSQNVKVVIDENTGVVKVFKRMEVIEGETAFDTISLIDAKEKDPEYKIGDVIEEEVTPKDFGRIAAQTAKQVVVQRIREAERSIIYDQYFERESEIVNGIVQRFSKGTIFINLGNTEAVLLPSEQTPNENYTQSARLKTYIVEVKKTSKGPQVLVSRTHPGLVKRLFELEVPEIYDGEVEIRGISREAGSRTKISVFSLNENVDPVGACVGSKGSRVQSIVDELKGEKIDIIKWDENPEVYIANSLSPSKVEKVIVDEKNKSALVVVPDYQLSLAIGKEGQNARLAAKLTNWKIDIKSLSQYEESLIVNEPVEEVKVTEEETQVTKEEINQEG
ncbi:transcription termination factor NusA [Helicovermis profundi]